MVLALRSFLRIAAGDKLLFWDTSQAGENLANHLVDDLIQNVHSVAGLPGAIRLLAEFSVAGVANAERIVQSTIGELTPFPAGRQGEPCTTVAAVNVIGKQCLSTGTKRNMVFGFFRCVGRAIFPDTLCSFKLLLRDDLEFGHQFGAGISAAENAHVGQVADHSSQAARMPALSRAGTVSSIVQIGGNPLCAVTLVYIFIEDQPNDFGFLLVDMQFVEFVLALVDAATFHKVITIRRTAALEVSFFHKLPQAGTGTDRSFFAFAVCLPEADIVQQFVSVVVESLLTLLGTPYPDAVSYKPFYDKWRFICDASDTVEHEHQQNIKFALSGVFLDDLQLVTGFCADFVARHAFFLFFMEILYRVIAAITSVLLGAMIAGGIGVVSAVVSAPFKLFGLAGIIIAYVLITPIATLVGAIAGGAVAGPFEVARYRYYLSLRKNGIRPKVTCIFDAFDFFMQFALVTGVRMLTIMWIPVLIQFATLLLAAVVAAASRSYLAAMLLVMIGMIAALVVAAYRSYQFWPMALVQADHPQLNAEQVMERCKVMTEGHKFDLFVFDLSYLGWNILSLLTGGILSVLYVAPYKMMATAFVYEEMKGRPVMVDDIKPSTDGNGMTIAVDPKKLMGIGSTGGKKPTSHIPAASRAAGAALEGVAGMYAGSSYPLEPNQPVILGRDPAYAKIVFSQGAQKISRRHCEVMFNSQVQKYRVTDFSSNGTYVNGSRLPANSPVLLTRGTELALGDNNNIIRLS